MARISIKRREEITPIRARDALPPERQSIFSDGELDCARRRFFPDTDEELELFEIEFEPNTESQAHAHSSAEIIYVMAGELHLGSRVCGPGTAIFIDANTLYAFRTGPDGARFLNFRGSPRPEYITKDEFLSRRKPLGSRTD